MKVFGIVAFLIIVVVHADTIPEKVQKGITLLNDGNIDGASEVLAEVIRENPQHGPARFLLGQIAIERNQWTEAEEHLKIAVISNPRRPHLAWQLYGKLQLLQHKYPEAQRSFEQSLQHSSDFLPALIGRARSALFMNNTATALSDLQKAASAESPEAALLLAELLIYLDRDGEAKNHLTSFNFKEPDHANTTKLLLNSISTGAASEKDLKRFVGENLGQAEGYLALAVFELRKQNKKGAVPLFQIAFQLNDQNPIGFLFLKTLLSGQNIPVPKIPHLEIIRKITAAQNALKEDRIDQARDTAQQILNERPMHIPAELILIDVAEKEQNYWDALTRYKKILSWAPGIPTVEARLATLAHKMEAYDLTECHIRNALQIQPENGYLHHVLATVLKAKQQIDPALNEAERSIALGFHEARAYVALGDIYYEKMEISKSIAALAKAVEMDPHAAENIASFALSALTTEDYTALRNILETHAKANPENIETLYSLAMMRLNENDLQRAKGYLTTLERLAPNHSQVYYNLGLVNFRLGLAEEGSKAMVRFEELKQKEREEWLKHNEAHKIRLQAQDAHPNESIPLYLKLVSENLAETKDMIALGHAYAMVKKQKEAHEWFEKTLKSSPYNRDALAGAVQTAEAIGKNDMAELYSSRLKMLTEPCVADGPSAGSPR